MFQLPDLTLPPINLWNVAALNRPLEQEQASRSKAVTMQRRQESVYLQIAAILQFRR